MDDLGPRKQNDRMKPPIDAALEPCVRIRELADFILYTSNAFTNGITDPDSTCQEHNPHDSSLRKDG